LIPVVRFEVSGNFTVLPDNPHEGDMIMEEKIDTGKTVTLMEAAEQLGTTHLRILMLIKEGALKGTQEGGEWFVTSESIDCFRKHGGEVRAQVSCRKHCGEGGCGGH
jgi:hypothetical protein